MTEDYPGSFGGEMLLNELIVPLEGKPQETIEDIRDLVAKHIGVTPSDMMKTHGMQNKGGKEIRGGIKMLSYISYHALRCGKHEEEITRIKLAELLSKLTELNSSTFTTSDLSTHQLENYIPSKFPDVMKIVKNVMREEN